MALSCNCRGGPTCCMFQHLVQMAFKPDPKPVKKPKTPKGQPKPKK